MTGAAPDRRVRKSTSSDKRRKPSSLLKATSQTLRSMERRPAFRQGLSSWGSVKLSRSPIRRRRQPRSGRSRLSRLQRPYLLEGDANLLFIRPPASGPAEPRTSGGAFAGEQVNRRIPLESAVKKPP